jgi:hypothetical protein
VLGFDDAISRDHGWRPRCQLLLEPAGFEDVRRRLDEAFAAGLPLEFRGYSTSFSDARRVTIQGRCARTGSSA